MCVCVYVCVCVCVCVCILSLGCGWVDQIFEQHILYRSLSTRPNNCRQREIYYIRLIVKKDENDCSIDNKVSRTNVTAERS